MAFSKRYRIAYREHGQTRLLKDATEAYLSYPNTPVLQRRNTPALRSHAEPVVLDHAQGQQWLF
jgi:hypothetical protein